MNRATSLIIACIISLCIFTQNSFTQTENEMNDSTLKVSERIEIKGLYDNYSCGEDYIANHGFSCLIEIGDKSYLFDAGKSAEILLKNCSRMNVDFSKINTAVISHHHGDHMGGMAAALKMMNNAVLYTPEKIENKMKPENFKFVTEQFEEIKKSAGRVVFVTEPCRIDGHLFSTGVIESRCQEQSLIIDTEQGIIIITGCAHAGPVAIVKKAKEIINKPVRLLLGGFHLADNSQAEVLSIINQLKELGVKKCAATHCSGSNTIKLFREQFKDNYVNMGAGKILEIGEDF